MTAWDPDPADPADPVAPPGFDASPAGGTVQPAEAAALIGDGTRLARVVRRLQITVWLVAGPAAVTGLVALVLGLAAWGGSVVGAVLVLVACAPALTAPVYVARRTSALVHAASQPRELANQARDLVLGLRASPALDSVAGGLRRLVTTDVDGARRGRIRRGLSLLRLVSSLLDQATPDPKRHPLLVPFQPARLAAIWKAVLIALWGWLAAAVVALVAAVVILARLL